LLHFLVRLACVRHAASVDSEPGSNSHLKPVVCRRVVGRLPPSPRKKWWFYLVRSLGFHPSLPLTTGTFNLVVKEPNRLPPERRAFSPMRRHTSATPPVLETCTSYLLPALTVNPLRQWDFHCFSTLETSSQLFGPQFSEDPVSAQRNATSAHTPVPFRHTAGSARAQAEVDNLEKDHFWRFFAKKRLNPSRNSVPE
jgi:hypothetical protein